MLLVIWVLTPTPVSSLAAVRFKKGVMQALLAVCSRKNLAQIHFCDNTCTVGLGQLIIYLL